MKATNIWQVMTPIKGATGEHLWYKTPIVARFERDAERVAEQAAIDLGFAFEDDIKVQHVRKAITEDGP